MVNGKRGPVGKAADALKAALMVRLHSPGSFSPVDEGLRAAIHKVDAFLASSHSESEADLQRLKDDVKRAMLNSVHLKEAPKATVSNSSTPKPKLSLPGTTSGDASPKIASPTASMFGKLTTPPLPLPSPSRNGSKLEEPQGSRSSPEKPSSRDVSMSPLRPARSAAPMGLPSTSGRGILDIGRSRTRLSQSAHLPDIRTDTFGQKPNLRSSVYVAETGEADWTMPRSLLNRFAFVDYGSYDKMILAQDELARQTEDERRRLRRSRDVQNATSLKQQMAEHAARDAHEAQLRHKEQEEVDASVRRFEAEEHQRLERNHEQQAATRALYDSQVREVNERKRREAEQLALAKIIERQEHLQQQEEDRLIKELQMEENKQYREQYHAELQAMRAARQAGAEAMRLEDLRLNEEAIRVLEVQEARRLAFVQGYKDKVARMAAKAGSEALQASQDELAAAAAARAERLASEHERALSERDRREKFKREADKRDRLSSLDQQMAAREAAKRAEAVAAVELKRQLDQETKAEAQRVRDAKEAKKARQRVLVQEQKEAVLEERRRRFQETRETTLAEPEGYHKQQLEGVQPSVVNVSVPFKLPPRVKATSS